MKVKLLLSLALTLSCLTILCANTPSEKSDKPTEKNKTEIQKKNNENEKQTQKKLPKNFKILFIGNSYTYVNHVPNTFKMLGKARGRNITVDMVAPGGYTLERHAKREETIQKIQQGGWDVVVLQDQSSTPSCNPQGTLRGTQQLQQEIAKIGAQTWFYMTPSHYVVEKADSTAMLEEQDLLNNGYNAAAKLIHGKVSPVGEAFRNNYLKNYTRKLHSPDHSHFNTDGSYLAALVLYCAITNEKAKGLPAPKGVNKNNIKTLQDLADQTLKEYGTSPKERVITESEIKNKAYFDRVEKERREKEKNIQE